MTTGGTVEAAAAAARRGALVVFPTDTVYGIGTRPDDQPQLRRGVPHHELEPDQHRRVVDLVQVVEDEHDRPQ